MTKITLQKQDDCFMPYDAESLEYTKKLPEGSVYTPDIKRSRNPQYHRYAFAMFQRMHDMVETDLGFDPWRRMLLIKAGYFTAIGKVDVNGTVSQAVQADSMNYENMEEEEFRECFKNIHRAFVQKYGERLTYDQLTEWSLM